MHLIACSHHKVRPFLKKYKVFKLLNTFELCSRMRLSLSHPLHNAAHIMPLETCPGVLPTAWNHGVGRDRILKPLTLAFNTLLISK